MSLASLILPEVNGIQNLHQLKKDNQWRLNNRQDIYTHPRYFIWKPVLPQQIYMSPKTSLVPAPLPISYSRYGYPHVAPIHHQSYMFAIPTTKAKNYPYQAVKEMGDKRPGSFHHIIINAVMPKPHFPPPPPTPPTQHLQKAFRKYRANKQLYHQYLNTHTTGRQNISKPIISQQQTQIIKPIYEHSSTVAPKLQTLISMKSTHFPPPPPTPQFLQFTKNPNIIYENKKEDTVECDMKSTGESNQVGTNKFFCNILSNYQNASQLKENEQDLQSQQQSIPSSSGSNVKSLRSDMDAYTTQKPAFLPTPIVPRNITTQSTVTTSNFITFLPLKQNDKTISNFRPTHDGILTRNDAQQHSFFTIEDAITKASPINQVFNHPFEAYRHARKRQQHYIKPQRQINSDLMTTKNTLFQNFFDETSTSETRQIDDYSMLDNNYNENETPINYFSYRDEYRNMLQPILKDDKSINSEQYNNIKTTPYSYSHTTKISTTTTVHPSIFEIFNTKATTTKQNLPTSITTTKVTTDDFDTFVKTDNYQEIETTTSIPLTDNSIYTTVVTSTTTSGNKLKKVKVHLKRPYHPVPTSGLKYKKSLRGLFKPYKNITITSTTTPLPTTKKTAKYQRQYKSKKTKHIKYASPAPSVSSTRSIPTTSISTTISTTDAGSRVQSRVLPTRSSESESDKQQKVLLKRTSPSTQSLDLRSTEKPNSVSVTKIRRKNKSRRRNNLIAPNVTTSQSASLPKFTSTAVTTTANAKFTRVPANSELRKKHSNNSTINIVSNKALEDLSFTGSSQSSKSLKLFPTKDSSVPPLPIEIYFKKSHNAKI